MPPCTTASLDGLSWEWTHKLYVFNGTKHVVYVSMNDLGHWAGLDTGVGIRFPVTLETRMVTLSYYTDTHDLMSVFVWDNGDWTTKLTPMVLPSCYTNDRRTSVCTLKKHARMRACSELFVD
jgi:hypothetical protein